jgi:hypothetical protein
LQKQVDDKKRSDALKRKEAKERKQAVEKSRIENEPSSTSLISASPIESTTSNTAVEIIEPKGVSLNENSQSNSRSVINKTISIEDRWQSIVGPEDSDRLFKDFFTPEEASDTNKEITLIMLSNLDRSVWYSKLSSILNRTPREIKKIIAPLEAKIIELASKFC